MPIQVISVRQIFNDGNHNAFTDLCHFQDRYFLAFRSCPDGHMIFTSSQIVILASDDGQDWEEVYRFSVPKRDVRDPHLLIFQGKLIVYTGTWWVDENDSHAMDVNDHLGFCSWTEDGRLWHGPQMLDGTHGHYIWRAATYDGVAYLNGRRIRNFEVIGGSGEPANMMESWLLHSVDGFTWLPLGLIQPTNGDETALYFEEDGTLLAIARAGSQPASLCSARPPYTEWSSTVLDRYIGGPLLTKWGNHYLVGGRKRIGNAPAVTSLYELIGTQLQEIAELPSGGDNSYPGFAEVSATRGLLSFYSSHEGSGTALAPSAIYLAELAINEV